LKKKPFSRPITLIQPPQPSAASQLADQLINPSSIDECALSAISLMSGLSNRQPDIDRAKWDLSLGEEEADPSGNASPAAVKVVGCVRLTKARLGFSAVDECRRLSALKNVMGRSNASDGLGMAELGRGDKGEGEWGLLKFQNQLLKSFFFQSKHHRPLSPPPRRASSQPSIV